MRVIGIDPGTRNLGWGVIERAKGRLHHVDHGIIRMSSENHLAQRLSTIFDELSVIFERFAPEVASVEQIFFHKDAQAAAKLGHARGVVLLCLERAKVVVHEHAPARVKRTLTGNGQADKAQVAQMVKLALSLSTAPKADAADALALAITESRLDPRAVVLEAARKSVLRKKVPEHLARAIAASRAKRQSGA